MTAAVYQPSSPELFRNLIASQPNRREQSSFAPTVISLLFHVSVIGALIWASSQIKHAAVARPVEATVVIPIASDPAPQATPTPPTGGGVVHAVTRPALPVPGPILDHIPPASASDPGFAEPGDAPAPGGSIGVPGGNGDAGNEPTYVPRAAIMPALLNGSEVKRLLERTYPAMLRDAGIGGKAVLWLYINETGTVVRSEVKESSGQAALDEAALKVASFMKFSPARNGDTPVRVMVAVPIFFATR